MKRYDVCIATGPGVAGRKRLIVVLQHDNISDLDEVVVAPLYLTSQLSSVRHLRPKVRLDDQDYLIAVDRLGAMPRRQLGAPLANLEQLRYEITKALDLLFTGF